MNSTTPKEKILKKIRKALTNSTPIPFSHSEGNSDVFVRSKEELEVQFAQTFTNLMGKFAYCLNQSDLAAQLNALIQEKGWSKIFCIEQQIDQQLSTAGIQSDKQVSLNDCDVAITGCECLVARTGSIWMSSAQESGRTTSVYAPVHICIAYTHQLVYDIRDAIELTRKKYDQHFPSLVTLATGPSRTADIEKTLVVGIHGPKEVYVFLVDRFQ
ncbi:LutC/YkgG family protein [Gynurincola endophyticus]|uniref:LutC/YkgG family protein n=1 Tax=Gynurincola endophyticus TaxID=2479004 RepID=UPI000F8D5D77|nr:lactate utilization protein [Gynurincola endophyticus]